MENTVMSPQPPAQGHLGELPGVKMMFHIMKNDASYAAGAHKIASARTRQEADRAARKLDTTLNGIPMGRTFVLDQLEFDEWHRREIAPLYLEERR